MTLQRLEQALEGLEAGESVGTSGFTTREDILCMAAQAPEKHKTRQRERSTT
jgi:hypothetical protein